METVILAAVVSVALFLFLAFIAGKIYTTLQFIFFAPTYIRKQGEKKFLFPLLAFIYSLVLGVATMFSIKGDIPSPISSWLIVLIAPNATSMCYEIARRLFGNTTSEIKPVEGEPKHSVDLSTAEVSALDVSPETLVLIETFGSMWDKIQGMKTITGPQAQCLETRIEQMLEHAYVNENEAAELMVAVQNGVENSIYPGGRF